MNLMNNIEKASFYNDNKEIIHPKIKSDEKTKPLWRKLFWTTGRDSNEYKAGCVDIFKDHFISDFQKLTKQQKIV